MKITKLAVFILLAVFLISLIALAPATLLQRFIPADSPLQLSQLSGRLWKGNAKQTIYQGRNLGSLDWNLKPLSLLTGKLGSDFKLNSTEIQAEGYAKTGSNNQLTLKDTVIRINAANLPLEGIASAVQANGTVIATIKSLDYTDQQIEHLEALVNWNNASISAPIELKLGAVEIDANGDAGNITANIKSAKESQLDISGTVTVDPELKYQSDILIKTKPNTPAEITNMLPLLGQTQADGSVVLKTNGVIPR